MASSSAKPIATAKIAQGEIEEKGKKRMGEAGFEFDLTGAVRAWVSRKLHI